jgi:predicted restriction endonuclease
MPLGRIWRDIVHEALERIGGSGSLGEIYRSVEAIFIEEGAVEDLTATWQAIVRRELEYNSSESESFQHRHDLFKPTKGIGAGHWSLRANPFVMENAEEIDLSEETKRQATFISRIIRDSRKVRSLKKLHDNVCQLCRGRMTFPDGTGYSEVHHLRPLGKPHNGPDNESNMLVVCPNCHVLLDFGARPIDESEILTSLHRIGVEHVLYNNSLIRWKVEPIA